MGFICVSSAAIISLTRGICR
uniref:Uncharacterized protein n=1 Tax=Rhizophora mucronata TaxID=61149 RepID=A0A2P2QKI0_RHIMU